MPRQKETEKMSIRPMKPKRDRKALIRLAKSLPDWFDHEDVAEMEEDLLHDACFVAEWNRKRVGFVTFGTPESAPAPGRIEITWLLVDRTMHRKGVGKALLDAVEENVFDAYGEGTELIVWTVADGLESFVPTRAFYRKHGFEDWYVDESDLQIWKYPRLFFKKTL